MVICGGNIDMSTLKQIYQYGLRSLGRFFRVNITTSDAPGNLVKIVSCAAQFGLKVHSVSHNRGSGNINWSEVTISVSFYSNSFKHQLQFLNSYVTQYQRFPEIVGREFIKDHDKVYKVGIFTLSCIMINSFYSPLMKSWKQQKIRWFKHQSKRKNNSLPI